MEKPDIESYYIIRVRYRFKSRVRWTLPAFVGYLCDLGETDRQNVETLLYYVIGIKMLSMYENKEIKNVSYHEKPQIPCGFFAGKEYEGKAFVETLYSEKTIEVDEILKVEVKLGHFERIDEKEGVDHEEGLARFRPYSMELGYIDESLDTIRGRCEEKDIEFGDVAEWGLILALKELKGCFTLSYEFLRLRERRRDKRAQYERERASNGRRKIKVIKK